MVKAVVLEKLSQIGNLAISVLDIQGLELVDVEFIKEAGLWYLRYYVDKPGGVTLDDCQSVSNEISGRLDIEDPIPQSYTLEVSSPGIERPLKNEKDFLRYIGSSVEIKTYEALKGKKAFNGTLKDFKDGNVVIEGDTSLEIPFEKISSAKLKFNWNGALK